MSSVLVVLVVLVVLAVLVVAAAVAAAVLGARAVGRNATRDMVLLPGMSPKVPSNWFGSHDPEAKLWRRLREAVRGVQASDAEYLGAGGTAAPIEQQALRVEEQLVAVSRIPRNHRAPILAQLEREVDTIERLCAGHVGRQAGLQADSPPADGVLTEGRPADWWSTPEVAQEIDAMSQRLDLIAMARMEKERNEGPHTG